jgi:hypothetical protein
VVWRGRGCGGCSDAARAWARARRGQGRGHDAGGARAWARAAATRAWLRQRGEGVGAGAAWARRRGGVATSAQSESERVREKEGYQRAIYALFAECPRSGTRQRFFFNFKIRFAECQITGTQQSSLCRVSPGRHSAKTLLLFFAECHPVDTRQSPADTRQSTFVFFYFTNQTFCGVFLHYVDLHVPFWDNYNCVFNS